MKNKVLCKYLKENDYPETTIYDIEERYDFDLFYAHGNEYLVLDDVEADDMCKEYILDSIWAFNAEFIASHCKINERCVIDSIKAMQENCCESCNEAIKAMIKDIDYFVDDAIRYDGRGHFLSSYDGNENEFTYNKKIYFIYKN